MATQTVGEVLTYFEGIAEGLFKTIDKIDKRLDGLSKKQYALNLNLDDKITKSIEAAINKVNSKLDGIENNLNKIFSQTKKSIEGIKDQTSYVTDSIIMKVEKDASLTLKRIYARLTTFSVLTGVALSFESVYTIVVKIVSQIDLALAGIISWKSFLSTMADIGKTALEGFANQLKNNLILTLKIGRAVQDYFTTGGAALAGMLKNLGIVNSFWAGIVSGTYAWIGLLGRAASQVAWVGIQQSMYKLFLQESIILVQRLTGVGLKANTPLEHASSLVASLDKTLHSVQLTGGQIFKTASLGILTIFGPFSGIIAGIPFINSLTDSLLNFGAKGRSTFLSWLGSGKAQLEIIFLRLKDISFSILPIIENVSKRIRNTFFGGGFFGGVKRLFTEMMGFKFLNKTIDGIIAGAKDFFSLFSNISKLFAGLKGKLNFAQVLEVVKINTQRFRDILVSIPTSLGQIEFHFLKLRNSLESILTLGKTTVSSLIDEAKKVGDPAIAQVNRLIEAIKQFQAELLKAKETAKEVIPTATASKPLLSSIAGFGSGKQPLSAQETLKTVDASKKVVDAQRESLKLEEEQKKASQDRISKIGALLKLTLDYKVIQEKLGEKKLEQKKLGLFSPEFSRNLSLALTQLKQLSQTSMDEFNYRVATLGGNLNGLVKGFTTWGESLKKLGLEQQASKVEKFGQFLTNMLTKLTLPGSKERAGEILANFSNALDASAAKLGVRAETVGKKFNEILKKSLLDPSNRAEYEKALDALAAFIMEFFPQSPAKRGPLTKLGVAGGKIVDLLASGMKKGTEKAGAAAGEIAEKIAGYFPRSPVLFGALVHLTMSGLKIPLMIAQGMLQGVGFVAKAAITIGTILLTAIATTIKGLANLVLAPIKFIISSVTSLFSQGQGILEKSGFNEFTKWATEINYLGQQMNLTTREMSKFDFMLKTVGGSANDMTYAVRSIGESINKAGDIQERIKFQSFGIDLRAIAKSGKPVEEMFFKISDALKTYPKHKQEILSLIGVFAGSATARLLEKPRKELEKLGVEALKSGATISDLAGKLSTKYTETINKLKSTFMGVRNELLVKVLPLITDGVEKIYDLFLENRDKITTLITAIVVGVKGITAIVVSTATEILKDPQAAFEELKRLAGLVLDLAKNIAFDAFSIITVSSTSLLKILWLKIKDISLAEIGILLETIYTKVNNMYLQIRSGIYSKLGRPVLDALGIVDTSNLDNVGEQQIANQRKILELKGKILQTEISIANLQKDLANYQTKIGAGYQLQEARIKNLQWSLEGYTKELQHATTLVDAFNAHTKQTVNTVENSAELIAVEYDHLGREIAKLLESMKAQWAKFGQEATDKENMPITNKVVDDMSKLVGKIVDLLKDIPKEAKKSAEESVESYKLAAAKIEAEMAFAEAREEVERGGFEFGFSSHQIKQDEPLKLIVPPAIDAIANAITNSITTFVEKGKIGMAELADISKSLFDEAFKDVLSGLKKGVTKGLTELFGAQSELMSGLMSGILAIGAFLMTRLKSAAEVTHNAIEDSEVESTAAMRGVIAGIESIGIQEVSQRLVTGIGPLLEETKGIRFLVAGIAEDLRIIRENFRGPNLNLLAGY